MRSGPVLLLALLAVAFASEESCMGRCENGFDSQKTCQCDSMCKYYHSCCSDYEVVCRMNTRGDTFVLAEDDEDDLSDSTPTPATGYSSDDESSSNGRHRSKPTRRPISTPTTASTTWNIPVTTPEITTAREPLEVVPQRFPSTQATPVSQRVSTSQKVLKVPVTQADPVATTAAVTTAAVTTATTEVVTTTTQAPDPDAEECSGRPFDSFMQMKNGSIFAFRGEYFFELGQKSVLPGYPKLIKDVWGISGPIDAAFTRVNCQGKTYIFKGNKYWRFDDGVLDDDYPRDINVGFDRIPDHVDAAFTLPAHSHHGKEKVYFFKGDQYYQYEFLHQPSHEECVGMTQRSPSVLFRRYTDLYYSNYQRFFRELFPDIPHGHGGHHFINKDWKGIKSPVDAVLAGRIYVTPWSQRPDQRWDQLFGQQWNQQFQQFGQQWDQQFGQQWGRRRQSRSPSWESVAERGMGMGQGFAERGIEMGFRLAERDMEERMRLAERDIEERLRLAERGMEMGLRLAERGMEERLGRDWERRWDQDWDQDRRRYDGYRRYDSGNYDSRYNRDDRSFWEFIHRGQPLQSVYFFKGDKYYRVDLKTKRVDPASPPYPRSIAKYWLGCSDTTGQEKK